MTTAYLITIGILALVCAWLIWANDAAERRCDDNDLEADVLASMYADAVRRELRARREAERLTVLLLRMSVSPSDDRTFARAAGIDLDWEAER